jgi:hypothetical protein
MFSQLHITDWSVIAGIVALLATFGAFVAIVVATLRYPKSKIEKLENLPWEDDQKP